MGVVGLLGLLIGSFAILSASVSSESSPPDYSAADGETPPLVLEVERLKGQTARLKVKLEDVGVATENISTALRVNAPAWELGSPTAFNVSQAMGVWRWIEYFEKDDRPSPDSCEEFIFNLTGSTVGLTRRWTKWTGVKREVNGNCTVDTQSPHFWRVEGWWLYTWVTTDYANWAVLMGCVNKELSSCNSLRILARERTLPPATLEMLRNVAEQRGFPKAHGTLVNQTSC